MESKGSLSNLDTVLPTPVLFLVFNRPSTSRKVFEQIKRARPQRLYIAADGPRKHKAGERDLCLETRALAQEVDWPCEVKTLFREENLGCKLAVSSAISWFFEQEEAGIILEDDCIPDQSFFPYCTELLEKYRDDSRVMQIGGNNFQRGWVNDPDYSYYFSRYAHIWGWATWRRAWQHFDLPLSKFEEVRDKGYLNEAFVSQEAEEYFWHVLEVTRQGILNSWGYRWQFALTIQNGLTVVPHQNLVRNIGFGDDSTHTGNSDNPLNNVPTTPINFPLKHPGYILWDQASDLSYFNSYLADPPIQKLKNFVKKFIPKGLLNKPHGLAHNEIEPQLSYEAKES